MQCTLGGQLGSIMKTLIQTLLVLSILTVLSGCSPDARVNIYNNSGSPITIISNGSEYVLQHEAELEESWLDIYFIHIEGEDRALMPVLRVATESGVYDYKSYFPAEQYKGHMFTMFTGLQVDPDYSILHVPQGAARPVARTGQPDGMPLTPAVVTPN
jgi:hypothetical protein